ncbi:MAG: acyltransferase [Woeseiaceae bacterium]|nr:acyltransferase [Woeseiaceae bacterium]
MQHQGRIERDRYTQITYDQFNQSKTLRIVVAVLGVLTWPVTVPLALLSRLSDVFFLFCSQFLAVFPYVFGTIVRYEFYRFALAKCGRNVMIGFGTVFIYRDIEIGDNVLIGMYNTIHHCNFGSYVLTAEGCRFLSGARYHNYDQTDTPMALQGGELTRIEIADDVWVGANAVVMASVASGAIVGAGAVVTEDVSGMEIVGGVPARMIGTRGPDD